MQKNRSIVYIRCLCWIHKTTEDQSDMMTADKEEMSLEHDTTMCGDPKVWFPMRVTYSRELKVKAELDRLEIENFIRVASKTDDSVMFLNYENFVGKEGKHVKIIGGIFEGVTGVIRRVKRCKRVVVEIEGVASVAIAYVPAGVLKVIG